MNSDHLVFKIWKHHYCSVLRGYSLYTSYSGWVMLPSQKCHNAWRVATLARRVALQESCTCDSQYAQRHCFQDWSRSDSASLRNSVSFNESTAEINTLPRKAERLCFRAVGFIFMTVNQTVILTIPALQSNKCNNLWPRLLAKQEWLKLKDWDTGKEEGNACFTRFDQCAIYTWKESWKKLDLLGTVGSRACLQLRSQKKDCMATRLLVPAWISNHSITFNLKTSERKWWTSIYHQLVIISWTGPKKQRCWVRSEFQNCCEGYRTFLGSLCFFSSSWTCTEYKRSLHEQWEPHPWGELPTVSHQLRCMSFARNTESNRNTTTSLGARLEGICSDHFIGRVVYSCLSPEWLASVLSFPLSLWAVNSHKTKRVVKQKILNRPH